MLTSIVFVLLRVVLSEGAGPLCRAHNRGPGGRAGGGDCLADVAVLRARTAPRPAQATLTDPTLPRP